MHDDVGAILVDISICGVGLYIGGIGHWYIHNGKRVLRNEDDLESEGAIEWADKDYGGDREGEVECEGQEPSDIFQEQDIIRILIREEQLA